MIELCKATCMHAWSGNFWDLICKCGFTKSPINLYIVYLDSQLESCLLHFQKSRFVNDHLNSFLRVPPYP